MSRTRMIKPQFFKHWDLYQAERASGLPLRVAFAGLWTVTDRAGRFRWKVDIKTDVLPYDDVDMITVLETLERSGFVERYVVAGKDYGFIPSFADHQTFHKTERASSLPAPLENGGPTVRHTADTGTGTGAVTQLVVDEELAEAEAKGAIAVRDPGLTALFLSICANKAATERWGESTRPYTQGSAASLYEVLRTAGVPPDVARLSVYRQCREMTLEHAPRSINYFRPGVLADWESEKARRDLAASGETPPAPPIPPSGASAAPSATGARREHWTEKKSREDREEAERQAIRVRAGNVDQRRSADDGAAWWDRMQREAKAANKNAVLYAYDRLREPADLTEPAHA